MEAKAPDPQATSRQERRQAHSQRAQGPGQHFIRPSGIVWLTLLLFLMSALAIYSLIKLWPAPTTRDDTDPDLSASWFWWTGTMSNETRLFIVVLCAGGLGGLAHSVRSLYWYVGNRQLRASWTLMYVSLPATGAGIALLTYLLLRGGLTTSFSDSGDVNPYGVAAICALVGLFAREAVQKLKVVFSTLLAPAEKGGDSLGDLAIDRFEPPQAAVGDVIRVYGKGLGAATQLTFGTGSFANISPASDTQFEVPVPVGATTGPLTVTSPGGTATSADELVISAAGRTDPHP